MAIGLSMTRVNVGLKLPEAFYFSTHVKSTNALFDSLPQKCSLEVEKLIVEKEHVQ